MRKKWFYSEQNHHNRCVYFAIDLVFLLELGSHKLHLLNSLSEGFIQTFHRTILLPFFLVHRFSMLGSIFSYQHASDSTHFFLFDSLAKNWTSISSFKYFLWSERVLSGASRAQRAKNLPQRTVLFCYFSSKQEKLVLILSTHSQEDGRKIPAQEFLMWRCQ